MPELHRRVILTEYRRPKIVGQRHGVLVLDVAALVPGPGLAEVGVVVVVVDPVGEVEGVGLVALLVISAVGDGSHAAEGNSGEQGGDCEGNHVGGGGSQVQVNPM